LLLFFLVFFLLQCGNVSIFPPYAHDFSNSTYASMWKGAHLQQRFPQAHKNPKNKYMNERESNNH